MGKYTKKQIAKFAKELDHLDAEMLQAVAKLKFKRAQDERNKVTMQVRTAVLRVGVVTDVDRVGQEFAYSCDHNFSGIASLKDLQDELVDLVEEYEEGGLVVYADPEYRGYWYDEDRREFCIAESQETLYLKNIKTTTMFVSDVPLDP